MSSFVGHGLVAIAVHTALRPKDQQLRLKDGIWMAWLIAIAWLPDLDHWIQPLHASTHDGLRITHSLLFCQLLPAVTIAALHLRGERGRLLLNLGLQASLTGFSQVLLDLLVGIVALPIFWPLSNTRVKFWGLLPSAGALDLYNYYFYYNLLIEMGILLPLSFCVVWGRFGVRLLMRWKGSTQRLLRMMPLGVAIAISIYFLHWSTGLSR